MREFYIRVWTGPTAVHEVWARTAADVEGTEHVGFKVHAETRADAESYVRRLFHSVGLADYARRLEA